MVTLAELQASAGIATAPAPREQPVRSGPPAYSITQVRRVMAELKSWIETSEETLDNAESADYPNDGRIDKLQTRLEALNDALNALGDIE